MCLQYRSGLYICPIGGWRQQQHLLHRNRKTLLKNTLPSHYRRPEVQDLAQAYNSNRYAVVEFNDFG